MKEFRTGYPRHELVHCDFTVHNQNDRIPGYVVEDVPAGAALVGHKCNYHSNHPRLLQLGPFILEVIFCTNKAARNHTGVICSIPGYIAIQESADTGPLRRGSKNNVLQPRERTSVGERRVS